MFTLLHLIAYIVLPVIGAFVGTNVIALVYVLTTLLPTLAVTVRRLHDTDPTGWWILIGIIPAVGYIVMLVFLASEGNSGQNKYGTDPNSHLIMSIPGQP